MPHGSYYKNSLKDLGAPCLALVAWESTNPNPPTSSQDESWVPHPFRVCCEKGGIPRTHTSSGYLQLLPRPPSRAPQPLIRNIGPIFQPGREPAHPAIAHRDGHIALESPKSRPPHRRAIERTLEPLLVQRGQNLQRRVHQLSPRLQLPIAAKQSLAIPRTHILADVATEYLPAHALHKLRRNRPAMLDGQVSNAVRCIQ